MINSIITIMLSTFILAIIAGFTAASPSLKNTKTKLILNIISIIFICVNIITIDLYANFSGLFYTKPNKQIPIDKTTLSILQKNKIPTPTIYISRFISDTITVKNKSLILPINYVAFNSMKMNYALALYIEANSINPDKHLKYKKLAEANPPERISFIQNNDLVIAKNRNKNDFQQILHDNGETICYFDISQFKRICKFTSIVNLNLDRKTFISEDEYKNNLLNNFEQVVNQILLNKTFSEYSRPHQSFDINLSEIKSIDFL